MAILHFEDNDDQLITLADIYFYDNALSFRSKGILALLYDLKEAKDLEFILSDVAYYGREGRDSIRSSFKELETLGYLSKKMKRDENGKFVTLEYTVHLYPANRSGNISEVVNLVHILGRQRTEQAEEEDRACPADCRKKSQNDGIFSQSDGKKSQSEQNFTSERTEKKVRAKPAKSDWPWLSEDRK